MDPLQIIQRYYTPGTRAHDVLVRHGRQVAAKAVAVARRLGGPGDPVPDIDFICQAAMLHDIGICLTDTPDLGCHGRLPYVCHGFMGRALLDRAGLPRHGLVCERHVGVGIGVDEIRRQHLPLPLRDMRPVSIEEIIVCYADKFFSKNGGTPAPEKTVVQIIEKLQRYGSGQADRFASWADRFGDR